MTAGEVDLTRLWVAAACRVQLWGAALPLNSPKVPCILDPAARVGVCGDWLTGEGQACSCMCCTKWPGCSCAAAQATSSCSFIMTCQRVCSSGTTWMPCVCVCTACVCRCQHPVGLAEWQGAGRQAGSAEGQGVGGGSTAGGGAAGPVCAPCRGHSISSRDRGVPWLQGASSRPAPTTAATAATPAAGTAAKAASATAAAA